MSVTWLAAVVLVAVVLCWRRHLLACQVVCCLFGGSAAMSISALAGAPITPAVLCLPFLVVRALAAMSPNRLLQEAQPPAAGFWLVPLVVLGVMSAAVMPRLFENDVLVYTLDRMTGEAKMSLAPLKPVSRNITQSAYLLAACAAYFAGRALLAAPGARRRFGDAVLVLAVLHVALALVNVGELYLGLPDMTGLLRNAGYAISDTAGGGQLGGLRRITGAFPEASAFAAFSLPLMAFCFSLWRQGHRARLAGPLAVVVFVLLVLSTSSTANAGVGIYIGCLLLAALLRTLMRGSDPRIGAGAVVAWCVAVAACLVLLLEPAFATRVAELIQVTLLDKFETASGVERGTWNQHAWSNFVDTWGLGVGLGTANASSFPLVLLSNLGFVGTLLFVGFVVQALRGVRAHGEGTAETAVARASGHALFATLIAASLSATVFDLGILFYLFVAAAAAPAQARPVHSVQVHPA